MKNKIILQILIVLIIFGISFFTYFKFLKIDEIKKNVVVVKEDENFQSEVSETIMSKERNVIENIKYTNEDLNGNKFIIEAKKGEIKENNTNNIILTDVHGVISFKGKSQINIYSKFAEYNSNNFDTKFFLEVVAKYQDNTLESQNLDIFFKDNYGLMYNNIKFSNEDSEVKADKLFFDLVNGDIKINMYNQDDKILIMNK
tara:strand:+ start:102 stop:704 length:603 start_codon:yes stop_codon:yes gene_type:complete